jgi:hypothetical protein
MSLHVFDRVAWRTKATATPSSASTASGGSSNTFQPLMPALARHRVVRIDLPGSGRSQRAEGALSIAR